MPVLNTSQAQIALSIRQVKALAALVDDSRSAFTIEETNLASTVAVKFNSKSVSGKTAQLILISWNGEVHEVGQPGIGNR